MRKILVVSSSRAERGLLEPIMTELKARRDIEAEWFLFDYEKDSILDVLQKFNKRLSKFFPRIILIPCDRAEMVHIATHSFNRGWVNCHFHTGDKGEGTTDEMNRYAISFLSHILLCNSEESRQNLLKLGFEPKRIFVVGSTALDHIEIDESLCPKEQYDLVLLHPDPISADATEKDLASTVQEIVDSHYAVWLAPNKDKNYEIILDFLERFNFGGHLALRNCRQRVYASYGIGWDQKSKYLQIYFENLPRPQFLGLLKNCKRAIGNSSSFTYELPLINPKAELIKIGHRNLRRTPPSTKTGASARIAEILATISLDDEFKRKRILK